MNDISALAAAASDQLYELERHEAFRRAEYELRHRQIAGSRANQSNDHSPAETPNMGAFGFSNERDRLLHGIPAQGGGQIVYPVSAAQPATSGHPAVPAGTLADPTYLVPPSCCHEECHKSYRKRLKAARQTQACPVCLTSANGSRPNGTHGTGHGGAGGDSSDGSTPKDRSHIGSTDDLTKLGGNSTQNGNSGVNGGNAYQLHHRNLAAQLAKLQRQSQLAAIQQARLRYRYGNSYQYPINASRQAKPYTTDLHEHRGLKTPLSAQPSREASPSSDDSSDDELVDINHAPPSPVLTGLRAMSLLQNAGRSAKTAPVSISNTPLHSRNASRASSPVEGHSATSGKHGLGSHWNRDAKRHSHPYSYFSTPNTPHFPPSKTRMSPPQMHRTLSGGTHGHTPRQSVEDILNSSKIPPPPRGDRTLPLPNSSSAFSSSVPSVSYSLSSQTNSTHVSPVTSRASSPVNSTHMSGLHSHHNHAVHAHSHLAHGVRTAFGMTPISRSTSHQSHPSSARSSVSPRFGPPASPPHKLPPLSLGGDGVKVLPSLSRGSSPILDRLVGMEVDGQA